MRLSKYATKGFKGRRPGVDLIKLFFGVNILTLFRNLEHFMAMQQIILMFMKWSSLQKSVSIFTPKLFYEIDPWPRLMATIQAT
jgi:hypothetical protein